MLQKLYQLFYKRLNISIKKQENDVFRTTHQLQIDPNFPISPPVIKGLSNLIVRIRRLKQIPCIMVLRTRTGNFEQRGRRRRKGKKPVTLEASLPIGGRSFMLRSKLLLVPEAPLGVSAIGKASAQVDNFIQYRRYVPIGMKFKTIPCIATCKKIFTTLNFLHNKN